MNPPLPTPAGQQLHACAGCRKAVESQATYWHEQKTWCEDCCLDTRMVLTRKTHWQYLASIKADDLIPGRRA